MEKPDCYGACPLQQWLYDSHERLEETIQRRLISDDPQVKLTPEGAEQLRAEQRYFRDASIVAAGTCRGLVARQVLYCAPEAAPAGRLCDAVMPANLKLRFGEPQ